KTKGYRVRSFENGEKCLKALDENPATIFLDLMMPGLDGTQTLKEIRKTNPDLPVIMVTSVDDVNTAVEVIKLGADDYILKPFDEARLLTNLEKAIQKNSLVNRVKHLEEELHGVYQFEGIIGKSPAIQKVLEKIHKVKDSKASVLIEGESGTGKELIARAIHYNSRFANGLFVDINCGAIPETLLESELFGHRKGAFTGALESRIGKLERADGGTLFLDEVAEMSANSQTKLLRFLQEKTFERIGENTKISVDTRVISATNKDLKAEVEKRNFREDLYYRLAVFPIRVPPLRERREDISLLCAHLLEKFRRELDKEVRTLSPAAMDCLMQFSWPGNVRQLENALYQGMINTDSSTIDVQHLPVEIQRADSQTLPTPGSDGDSTP
ncbi:MAG: response regulator, partial [Nitrospinaceae bacterium]|nr:sigma-54-dependent Fis family transcriptional regulator [Nitrospinaceae bacterium]NIR53264.1 sigma-54-dependent Fis family transcriptional regulator [Nitrospinaceae bacterium]NIS83662.1 sigma-54-dependent Fis family transcriptional regulator [Nitrospinaceae bacterium]NIT80451.1 sigma-54-dependent Fis family transcriptional regulator [Nitrospinaceae bacterium]NIU42789.1 sigma-54-dependent Fis family transcriptional regulator [Nitrospinaceae bacterium]